MSEQGMNPQLHELISVDDDLQLRALTEEDTQRLYDLNVANRAYLAEYLPWANNVHSPNDSRVFIDLTKEKRRQGAEYGFGIIYKGDVVGHISLMHLTDDKSPEIGYWIAQEASGAGITTKAANALTEFGFNELHLDHIIIRARESNTASNKIAEKLGYTFDGLKTLADEEEPHNYWIKTNPKAQD